LNWSCITITELKYGALLKFNETLQFSMGQFLNVESSQFQLAHEPVSSTGLPSANPQVVPLGQGEGLTGIHQADDPSIHENGLLLTHIPL
jgi:hypothetical protein